MNRTVQYCICEMATYQPLSLTCHVFKQFLLSMETKCSPNGRRICTSPSWPRYASTSLPLLKAFTTVPQAANTNWPCRARHCSGLG